MTIDYKLLFKRVRNTFPLADDTYIENVAKDMFNCHPDLKINLSEWLDGKNKEEWSEVLIRGKYTLSMAVQLMCAVKYTDADIIDAFVR